MNMRLLEIKLMIIKKLIEQKSEISKKILSSKKPIIIIGESALELQSGKFIFEEIKNYLINNNFINEEWNALNILVTKCVNSRSFRFKNVITSRR